MDRDETGPERTCIVTRRKASPEALIRFVVGPDGVVVPDIRRRLPGRGVWVMASRATVAAALRKQAFSRGFKAKVVAPAGLEHDIERLLLDDALQSLSMANKAGRVVAGFGKVETAIGAGQVEALLHASDGSDDGTRKLEAAWRRQVGDTTRLSIKLFSTEQLELALGRTNVIHAALAAGSASAAFLSRCRRLISYRSAAGQEPGTGAEAAAASTAFAGADPAFPVGSIG